MWDEATHADPHVRASQPLHALFPDPQLGSLVEAVCIPPVGEATESIATQTDFFAAMPIPVGCLAPINRLGLIGLAPIASAAGAE